MTHPHPERPICDYEGSAYRDDFWIGQGREYEDLAERIALSRLLPPRGRRLLEIGAGFGRLADLYSGYDEIVLLDYSRSLLQQARARWEPDPRFTFIAADLYDLPFFAQQFDAVVMIRVIHHLVDVPAAMRQAANVLAGHGDFVLEFANKRNIKAMARYAFGRQAWSPFDPEPYEFVDLNFDFHPSWMYRQLSEAGLRVDSARTLSHFRMATLKRLVPPRWLAFLDGCVQPTGAIWKLSPSVMVRARHHTPPRPAQRPLLRCLACGDGELEISSDFLECAACRRRWPVREGIYNLRSPAAET